MQTFRKKAHEVKGIQLTEENYAEVAEAFNASVVVSEDALDPNIKHHELNVPSMGRYVRAVAGDYIFNGGLGMTHVRKPEEFEEQFEVVE